MSITVSEKQLKNSAKRLKTLLSEKETTEFSYNQCLQLLSQSLTTKTFEELKATVLNKENNQDTGSVVILNYGSESILTSDGDYIKQLCVGSDDEITYNELYEVAELLANEKNTSIREFNLPEILDPEWQIDDVINLAEMLGYFKYERPLIDIIENSEDIIIESANFLSLKFLAPNNLNGDWHETIEDTEEFSDVVWFLEYQDEDYNFYEFYFTLNNIGKAEKINDNQWSLKDDDGKEFVITLL